MTTNADSREVTHDDLVTLTSFMAEHGSTAQEVAYAVEKPWKHLDWLDQADLRARLAKDRAASARTREVDAWINVVFDGPPGPTCGRFVEVETDDETMQRPNGEVFWHCRCGASDGPFTDRQAARKSGDIHLAKANADDGTEQGCGQP